MPQSLQQLQDWLQHSEPGSRKLHCGAAKKITWQTPHQPEFSDCALVYLHGFSATRQELHPLPDMLANSLQCNLFATRLHSHGLKQNALENLTLAGLIEDGEEALQIGKRIGQRQIILAASTGATLATVLAVKGLLPENAILIFLSPNFGTYKLAGELLMLPWLRPIIRFIYPAQREYEPQNAEDAACWTPSYPTSALIPMLDLVKLARQSPLEQVKNPLLILFSQNDQTVSIGKMRNAFERFASPLKSMQEIQTSDPNHHTLAGNLMSPASTDQVAATILKFIDQVDCRLQD